MKKRLPLPPMPDWGDDTSPHCQIDGQDRRVPFSLEGVPTISDAMDWRFKNKARISRTAYRVLRNQIQKATAELRRRYDQYGQQALASMLSRECEIEELTHD